MQVFSKAAQQAADMAWAQGVFASTAGQFHYQARALEILRSASGGSSGFPSLHPLMKPPASVFSQVLANHHPVLAPAFGRNDPLFSYVTTMLAALGTAAPQASFNGHDHVIAVRG